MSDEGMTPEITLRLWFSGKKVRYMLAAIGGGDYAVIETKDPSGASLELRFVPKRRKRR